MKIIDVIVAGKENTKSFLGVLMLGIFLPLLLYSVLPAMNVNVFADNLSMDVIFKLIFGLVGASIFLFVAYQGATRYFVAPVCALFLYQTLYRAIALYLPFVHLNFRALMLAFIMPVLIVVFLKYKYKHDLLKPYIPVFMFFLLNILYNFLGFAQAPNSVYSPDLYTQSANSIIPRSFELELTIFIAFIVISIYITCNIFYFQREKALSQFNKFIVSFLFSLSVFSIGMYFLNDPRMFNVLAGVKRLAGFCTHTNIYAFFSGCMLLYIVRMLYNNETGKNTAFKTLCILAIAAGAVGTLLTYSRINNSILLLFIVFNIIFLSKNKSKAILNLALLGLVGVLILVLLQVFGTIDIMDTISSRIADDGSSEFRPKTWQYLYSQLQWDWHILFGQGIGAVSSTLFKYYSTRFFVNDEQIIYHPHNSFFHIFFDYGIAGIFTYFGTLIWLLFIGFINLRPNKKLNINALFLIEIILYAMLSSIVDGYIFNIEIIPFWVFIVILYTQITADKEMMEAHAVT